MIKIIGIAIIFVASKLIYESYMDKNGATIKKTEDTILFINLLYVNMMELKMPFEVALSNLRFKISPFYDNMIEEFFDGLQKDDNASVRELIILSFSHLNLERKIKKEVITFLKVIGTQDKETVCNYKRIALNNVEKYLTEQKDGLNSKSKTAGALTFGISAVMVIIML